MHCRALYSKQLAKKKKTYHDGFVTVRGHSIVLLDEAGALLAETRIPANILAEDAENLDLWDGFLGGSLNITEPSYAEWVSCTNAQ